MLRVLFFLALVGYGCCQTVTEAPVVDDVKSQDVDEAAAAVEQTAEDIEGMQCGVICNAVCDFSQAICIEVPGVFDCSERDGVCRGFCSANCQCQEACNARCQLNIDECAEGEGEICEAKKAFCEGVCLTGCPEQVMAAFLGPAIYNLNSAEVEEGLAPLAPAALDSDSSDSDDLDSSIDSDDLDSSIDSDDLDGSIDSDDLESSIDSDDLESNIDSDNLDSSIDSDDFDGSIDADDVEGVDSDDVDDVVSAVDEAASEVDDAEASAAVDAAADAADAADAVEAADASP